MESRDFATTAHMCAPATENLHVSIAHRKMCDRARAKNTKKSVQGNDQQFASFCPAFHLAAARHRKRVFFVQCCKLQVTWEVRENCLLRVSRVLLMLVPFVICGRDRLTHPLTQITPFFSVRGANCNFPSKLPLSLLGYYQAENISCCGGVRIC